MMSVDEIMSIVLTDSKYRKALEHMRETLYFYTHSNLMDKTESEKLVESYCVSFSALYTLSGKCTREEFECQQMDISDCGKLIEHGIELGKKFEYEKVIRVETDKIISELKKVIRMQTEILKKSEWNEIDFRCDVCGGLKTKGQKHTKNCEYFKAIKAGEDALNEKNI